MAKNKPKKVVLPPAAPKPTIAVTAPAKSPFTLNPVVAYLILSVAVLAAFTGGWSNGFTDWDDPYYITKNEFILKPTFASLLTLLKVECALNYHPLTMASLWLNSFLFGKNPTSFVVTNTLIHGLNTLLVFQLTQKLTKKNVLLSLFVALIWGVHPLHIESVTWIAERKDVLYGLFFFWACLEYVNYLDTRQQKYWVYTILLFIASCLSKGMAVTLPLVLLLIDYWYGKEVFSTKNFIAKLPFFGVALIFGLLAIHVQGGGNLGGLLIKQTPVMAQNNMYRYGLEERLSFGFYGFWVYIIKFFIPFNQHNYYDYPSPEQFNAAKYTFAPVAALLLLGGIAVFYRKSKALFFGVLFFFATIVLVLQFISVGGVILAERYTYVPYFGLTFLTFYYLYQKTNQTIVIGLGTLISIIFIFLAYQQTKTYKDTSTLLAQSLKYEPNSTYLTKNLATSYQDQQDNGKIIEYGEQALSKGEQSYDLFNTLGNAYFRSGQKQKAADYYTKSIALADEKTKIGLYYNRAVCSFDLGNYSQAVDDFTKVINSDDNRKNFCIKFRAIANLSLKKYQESIPDFSTLIEKGVAVDTAYGKRGIARYNLGDQKGSIEDFKKAVQVNPNNSEAQNNLKALGIK